MADKVEFVITGRDQSAAALNSFKGNADSAFKSATQASRAFNSILTGGGVLIAFRTLASHLGDVAERFKSADSAAAAYARTSKLLSNSLDQGFLLILQAIAPAVKAIGDFMDPAALATKRLATATEDLKDAEEALAKARTSAGNRSGLNAPHLAALEKEVRYRKGALEAANATLAAQAKNKPIDLPGFANQNTPNTIGADAADRAEKAQKAATAQAKKAADELAKYNEDLVATRIKNEDDAADEIAKRNEEIVQSRAKREEEVFEDAKKAQADLAKDQLKAVQDQAQAFGDTFAANLIQSGETGFKGLLEQWKNTLIQMVAAAQAQRLFEAIFPKGFSSSAGGVIGGIASVLGFAGGGSFDVGGRSGTDANFVPLRLTRGEHVDITPQGGSRGGVNIVQNIDARGADSPARLISAMTAAKNAAIVEVQNARRRGR